MYTLRDWYLQQHILMWDWLHHHPDKKKSDYFFEIETESVIKNNCYLCEGFQTNALDNSCDECPLKINWKTYCFSNDTPFSRWAELGHTIQTEDVLKERS